MENGNRESGADIRFVTLLEWFMILGLKEKYLYFFKIYFLNVYMYSIWFGFFKIKFC